VLERGEVNWLLAGKRVWEEASRGEESQVRKKCLNHKNKRYKGGSRGAGIGHFQSLTEGGESAWSWLSTLVPILSIGKAGMSRVPEDGDCGVGAEKEYRKKKLIERSR